MTDTTPTLLLGDCAERMRELQDCSVDSIVTDCPYGIAFMGSKWDSFGQRCGDATVDERRRIADDYAEAHAGAPRYGNSRHDTRNSRREGLNFQAAMTPIFAEALRVAKPGAYMCCFGSPRTYHRLTCAIEDAGWSVVDCVMFVHGCLSEDSEILTEKGWKGIGEINEGDKIIAYNRNDKAFHVERCERTFLYDYKDTAYRIQSDTTDQLLSKNHRVLVERGGVEVFEYAENLAQEREICVPVLESLQDMSNDISRIQHNASSSQQMLFKEVSTVWEEEKGCAESNMSCVREDVSCSAKYVGVGPGDHMFKTLRRRIGGHEVDGIQQGASAQENGEGNTSPASAHDWGRQSVVERRSGTHQCHEAEAACEVGQMPDKIPEDGKTGRMGGRTSATSSGGSGASVGTCGGCSSSRREPGKQRLKEPGVVSKQRRPQEIRTAWKPATTLARITPEWYEGRMWCVSVPSGAIIVRRNGKVFITGNSGFPKGLNISKAIDKRLGAEREVIGTAPASAEAKEWDGWNTALKPAYEPIVIAQKPVEKTIIDNVLKHGTGAFNVDACRVPTENVPKPCMGNGYRSINDKNAEQGYRPNSYSAEKSEYVPSALGRYPANLVHDGSPEVLALFPNTGKSKGGGGVKYVGKHVYDGGYKGKEYDTVGFMDSGSAARFFYCAKPSRKERGEGNTHPTVKSVALMRWLVRLVTRRCGLVLAPFLGSGTTGIAALQDGMRFVGIEREEKYMEIAKRRIAEAEAEIEQAREKERRPGRKLFNRSCHYEQVIQHEH